MNVHFHVLVLDGVFTQPSPGARPTFHPTRPPSDNEIARLTATLRRRVLRLLASWGFSFDAVGTELDPGEDQSSLFKTCQAASVQGQIALGHNSGAPISRLGQADQTSTIPFSSERCANIEGFSLHANTRIAARDRSRLEKLCRYVARPPIATERLAETEDGRIAYAFRHPWNDGSTHALFTPQVFLERLAALIPLPRAHLVTYHGVFGANAALRDLIVPAPPRRKMLPLKDDVISHQRSLNAKVSDILPGYQRRYPWAHLLKRVLDRPIDSTRRQ